MFNPELKEETTAKVERLLLQIHDELILEVVAGEEEKISALVGQTKAKWEVQRYPLKAPIARCQCRLVQPWVFRTWHEAAH